MAWFYLALGSAVIWGISAVLQKDASHGEHAIQFAVSSSLLAAGLATILLPFTHLSDISSFAWVLLCISGLVGGIAYYMGAKGFKYLSLSEASPLYNLGTVIAIVMATIFLGEKMTLPQIAGVSLIIFGTYFLELKGNDLLSPFVKLFKSEKIHYVLIATFLSSGLAVFSKYILGFVDPVSYMFVHIILVACFLLVVVFTRHKGFSDIKKGFIVHRWMILAIAVLTVLGALTDLFSLKLGEAALFVPIMRTWTLIAVLLGGAYLKEGHMRNRIIATVIMLMGVFIIYL